MTYSNASIAVLCLAAWLPATATASTTSFAVTVSDGTSINAFVDRLESASPATLVLMLQGSGCRSVAPGSSARLPIPLTGNIARLDIDKFGAVSAASGSADCAREYLTRNALDRRVQDAAEVLSHMRANAPWWNGRLVIVGVSEGATVAASLTATVRESCGVAMINGSIGGPMSETWSSAMAHDGSSQRARDDLTRTWRDVRADPTADKSVFGATNTYKWWASILDVRPLELLDRTRADVFLIHSELDETVAVSYAHRARDHLAKRPNFTYLELVGLDHNFRDKDGAFGGRDMLTALGTWIGRIAADTARCGGRTTH